MKFELYHDKKKKTLSVPAAALKLSGLGEEEKLTVETGSGELFIAKERLTAKEMVAIVEFLSALASDYIVKLALSCGLCDDCGFCEMEDEEDIPQEYQECGGWKAGCDSGVIIPLCALKDAGIDPDVGVELCAEDGRVVVTVAKDKNDPLNELPYSLRSILEVSGVCMESLRDLLTSGEIIYG